MKVPPYSSKYHKSMSTFKSVISTWQEQSNSIVFTNGCFDIVHKGHIDNLEAAAAHGDKMVVGLNSDSSIKNIKGHERPIINQESRAAVLCSLSCVDAVVLFEENTPIELIKKILPNVIVKGDEYKEEEMIGRDIVLKNGGKIITLPMSIGYSSSDIINKIKRL